MRRVFLLIALMVALLGPPMLQAAAQEASPEAGDSLLAGLGYPELTVTTDGTDFDLPAEIAAGRYRVVLQNTSELSANIDFFRLPEGVTMDDLMAVFEGGEEAGVPDWFFETVFSGGTFTGPGETNDVILDLTPGEWIANLATSREGSDESTDLPKMVTIIGAMPALEEPADVVAIELVEMAFVMPETISTGPAIWKLTNTGAQPHHMVLFQVPDGTTEEQVLELFGTMFGPPAASPAAGATPTEAALSFEDLTEVFGTQILSGGRSNWLEVDLAAGTYLAVCFLPDTETGAPHVALGMLQVFTVE